MTSLRIVAARTVAALTVASLAVIPAQAHHSFGMFAQDKAVTMTGTVKSYAFRMPHVWFFMVVPTAAGGQEDWGFEMASPNLAVQKGWNLNSIKPGDKLTVTMHPMRDGSLAGSVMSVVMPDGRTLLN